MYLVLQIEATETNDGANPVVKEQVCGEPCSADKPCPKGQHCNMKHGGPCQLTCINNTKQGIHSEQY